MMLTKTNDAGPLPLVVNDLSDRDRHPQAPELVAGLIQGYRLAVIAVVGDDGDGLAPSSRILLRVRGQDPTAVDRTPVLRSSPVRSSEGLL
eukprot:9495568-Pyramimonas_sp.AAC.1